MFGGMGYGELMIVAIIAVLLFGGRLPSVARSMGRSLTEFKKGMRDIEHGVNDAIYNDPPREVAYDDHDEHDDQDEPAAPRFEPPTSPPRAETEEETASV